ncbi:unnamed protein product [Sympodiomycopsis kandeliae]
MAPIPTSSQKDSWGFSTLCSTVSDPEHADQYGSSSVPIYQSTTFKGLPGSDSKASNEFDYSRSGNPTRTVLQNHLNHLQGCKHSFVVATGMAAFDIITRSVKPGECIIAGDDIYGGTNRLLGLLATNNGIKTHHIDTTKPEIIEETVRNVVKEHTQNNGPRLGMVLLESPTNPLLKIIDIKGAVKAVRKYTSAEQTTIVLDNTMMSPALCRPLDLGVDAVYDSATKYLGGHHDIMAGVIATNREDLAKSWAFTINSVGNALGPFECFLLLRGLKTLSLRLNAQQASAQKIAEHLDAIGFKVNYPGLPNHPARDVHFSQAKGAGAVMSFETGDSQLSQMIVGGTRLWGVSVSFGCVNSLISMPCLMSHASIDAKVRAERGLAEDIIRMSVGIEDVEDLIQDLDAALLAAGAVERDGPTGRLLRVTRPAGTAVASSAQATAGEPPTLLVSAPGKVILFGEHAVVHGVTALAASVGLRCYALVQSRKDGKLHLELPDLGVSHDWNIADLPWDDLPSSVGGINVNASAVAKDLDAKLLRNIVHVVETHGGAPEGEKSHASCVAFLYLYMSLAQKPSSQGQTFTFRSLLPIGAGLGSSASYSACLSSALLHTHGHMSVPSDGESLSQEAASKINAFAFLAEKVIHGNPSGVDNSVAVFGGCLAFTRPQAPRNQLVDNQLKLLSGVHAKQFLLTDTGVGRDTKKLVAGVRSLLESQPAEVNQVLDQIQSIVDEASSLLLSEGEGRSSNDARLGELITQNHDLLVKLGVSHPSLELIRATLSQISSTDFPTKLTGAGGGGCSVTLLPASSSTQIQEAKETLQKLNFKVYSTTVGGSGVSILRNIPQSGLAGKNTEEGISHVEESLQKKFVEVSNEELFQWLESAENDKSWSRVAK